MVVVKFNRSGNDLLRTIYVRGCYLPTVYGEIASRGETERIRFPFVILQVKLVFHCHVLDHEDLGMMGNLMIKA